MQHPIWPWSKAYFCILLCLIGLIPVKGHAAAPLDEPLIETPSEALSTPAEGHLYTIPVVAICYLPTRDDQNVDFRVTGVRASLADIYDKVMIMNRLVKYSLEEGSRYHGYANAKSRPSLGYKIVSVITVCEELPHDPVVWNRATGARRPDYNQILKRFNARDFVEKQGVKEFWLWGYHHGDIDPTESNMSSPVTGDISNSERRNGDLPIFSKTFVLYNYNYGRSTAEAVHNHGHQMEAVLSYINQKQDGNTKLFWNQFVGRDTQHKPEAGRCGSTHEPSNTTKAYDYSDREAVESDIADWTPDGTGQKRLVSARTWGEIPYQWPSGLVPRQKVEAQWYLFWRQNIPGENNNIAFGDGKITNWWAFIGDWDNAIVNDLGLHTGPVSKPYSRAGQGSVISTDGFTPPVEKRDRPTDSDVAQP